VQRVSKIIRNIGESRDETEKENQIRELCKIRGIDLPIASAILAACYPEEFMIIDRRVWNEVYHRKYLTRSPKIYLSYNLHCLKMAKKKKLRLRDLDKAYWGKNYYSELKAMFKLSNA